MADATIPSGPFYLLPASTAAEIDGHLDRATSAASWPDVWKAIAAFRALTASAPVEEADVAGPGEFVVSVAEYDETAEDVRVLATAVRGLDDGMADTLARRLFDVADDMDGRDAVGIDLATPGGESTGIAFTASGLAGQDWTDSSAFRALQEVFESLKARGYIPSTVYMHPATAEKLGLDLSSPHVRTEAACPPGTVAVETEAQALTATLQSVTGGENHVLFSADTASGLFTMSVLPFAPGALPDAEAVDADAVRREAGILRHLAADLARYHGELALTDEQRQTLRGWTDGLVYASGNLAAAAPAPSEG